MVGGGGGGRGKRRRRVPRDGHGHGHEREHGDGCGDESARKGKRRPGPNAYEKMPKTNVRREVKR